MTISETIFKLMGYNESLGKRVQYALKHGKWITSYQRAILQDFVLRAYKDSYIDTSEAVYLIRKI